MNAETPNSPQRTARAFWLSDNHWTILADRDDTEGRYDLIEGLLPAGFETVLHRHTRYSEHLYQLEGETTVWLEGRTMVLGSGESFLIPTGAAHAIGTTSDVPSRALFVTSPSGAASTVSSRGSAPPTPTVRRPRPAPSTWSSSGASSTSSATSCSACPGPARETARIG